MNRNLSKIIMLILLSAILMFLINKNIQISKILKYYQNTELNDKAYLFRKKDLNNQIVTVKNKNVLLIFFNTTCKFCLNQSKDWEKLHQEYKRLGINVIGVSVDSEANTREFVSNYRVTFQIIVDNDHELTLEYLVKKLPCIIIIAKDGKIVLDSDRPDYNLIRNELNKLISSS